MTNKKPNYVKNIVYNIRLEGNLTKMGLSLNNIYQRPYVKPDRQSTVKKREEDEKSSATNAERQQESNQNSQSKGLQYVEQKTTPKYTPAYEQKFNLASSAYSNVNINSSNAQTNANYSPQSVQKINPATQNQIDSKINIAQILKDFNNTAVAIGTPDDLKQEVDGYLQLIQTQVEKDNPNVKLIKSNLKNASTILDNYISQTLNKDSKVVENWVDALFLQQIDFKYNENDINPQFLVKFPENSNKAEKTSQTEETTTATETEETQETAETVAKEVENAVQKTTVKVPQDKELKSLFLQSKKLAYANEPKKAIETFQKALVRANEVGDNETKSKIYYEVGKIYDDYDHAPQALKSYDLSIKNTTDNNIKTKAHYSMAQIYDDGNQIEPALDHYFVSVSFGGESENLAAQSTSLTRIGNIFSDMYEQNAFDYYDVANDLVSSTDNARVKGFVASNTARAYERFGEPQQALKSYSQAVQSYTKANSPQKAAQNYLGAADIMIDFNSNHKATGLLNKAKKFAEQANDTELLNEINSRLEKLTA